MAFGNIATFYIPIAGSAGSSLWGTDVRKLLDAADATSDATTKTNHGTGGSTTVRTLDPYTSSTADSDQTLYGWAITPTDMGGSSGARRYFPAGDHTLTVRASHSNISGLTGNLTMYVYRVGTAGASRARTLLGSATAAVSLPGVGAKVDAVVTVSLSEVVFEPDETIQYSMEMSLLGVAITGNIATYYTGTDTGTAARIATPGLRVLADTTGSATGGGTVSGVTSKVLGTAGSASGAGVTSGLMSARADTTGTATGMGSASGAASAVAGTIGTAAGTGTASGVLTAVGSMVGTSSGSGAATGVLGAIGGMTGSASGVGTAVGVLGATAGTIGSASGVGAATGLGSSVAGTVGSAAGTATTTGLASIVLGTVGTVEIGAPTSDVPDYPVTTPTKQIAGIVQHHETSGSHTAGDPVLGATVRLFRTLDDAQMTTTTSAADGSYQFLRDAADPYTYYVIAEYDDAGTPVHGVTDRGLVPELI